MKRPLTWFPLYVDSWLLGSVRLELTLEQRAVFVDLLALAAKDEGYIRANPAMPYPPAHLSRLLNVPEAVLASTISRCLDVGKLEKRKGETLYVSSWKKYALSRMTRWRIEAAAKKAKERDLKKKKEEEKKIRGEESNSKNVTPRYKNVTSRYRTVKKDAGLPDIPNGLPFKERDRLVEMRGEIFDREKLLEQGVDALKGRRTADGRMLTFEILQAEIAARKKEYRDRIKALGVSSKKPAERPHYTFPK